ncbi:tetratricopeptide repeat protein [Saccharothrix algeriensis]|uniref:Tetratricopeptide repeat protein n=1 Tax=Saccharothrix algeriensis TaxID=173560 RepID=A0A8T8I1Z5_9PSEU|nr:tetratricopeptide repeat protein [Saccharothrix algeriensis]
MLFQLLGEVRVVRGAGALPITQTRVLTVLAILAVEANRVVSVDALVDRLWGEQLPRRPREALYSYVSRLRTALGEGGDAVVAQRSGGYVLDTDPLDVDLHRFRALRGDTARLAEALGLWRGEAFTGLTAPWLTGLRATLARERLDAVLDLLDARLRGGEHAGLVAELTELAAAHPLDERIAVLLMTALYRGGRPAEALERYRVVDHDLAEQVGTDPGQALREAHRRVLADSDPRDPGERDAGERDAGPGVPARGRLPVPGQLPADVHGFVGRAEHLARLDALLPDRPGTPSITVVSGPAGMGKTTLAVRWAHRAADRFPDGQLHADLRGFDQGDRPADPADVLRGFLDGLGVPPGDIPPGTDARAARYRSLLAGKRVLVLLDNARDSDQVRPLLPGTADSRVLVTSRNRLTGLLASHHAHPLRLDLLTGREARHLLVARLGHDRVEAESAAADEVVRLCDRLPLALSVVAGRAASCTGTSLADLVAELRESGLAALDDGEPAASLPTVLSWSYSALEEPERRLFALLGDAPGPDTGLRAAASLAGLPVPRTAALLRSLVRASLLDHDGTRYRMHDLIRLYAASLHSPDRDAAADRLLDHYVHTAHAAAHLAHPTGRVVEPEVAAPGCTPERIDTLDHAWRWFRSEQDGVPAVQRTAVERGRDTAAWLLTRSLYPFHHMTADSGRLLASSRTALTAALRLADRAVHSDAHRFLGEALIRTGRHDEGMDHLRTALDIARDLADHRCLSRTHLALARAWQRRGQHDSALRCTARALRSTAALGDPVWMAVVRTTAGRSAALTGRHRLALIHCRAALPVQRRHGALDGEANTLSTLGMVALANGDPGKAVTSFRQALALFRVQGNAHLEADTLDLLADALHAAGEHDEARRQRAVATALYHAQRRTPQQRGHPGRPARPAPQIGGS